MLHAHILHTARSLAFVLDDVGDVVAAQRVEPAKHAGGEEANATNTGGDNESSEDLTDVQVPRKSLINTKSHAAILIGRRT